MPVGPNSSRQEQEVNLRKSGLTYAEIGRKLGLTRERVRQIAKGETTRKEKTPRNNPDALLTAAEPAELRSVHVNTVRRWSNKGIIRAYRISARGDRRFKREEIARFPAEFNGGADHGQEAKTRQQSH